MHLWRYKNRTYSNRTIDSGKLAFSSQNSNQNIVYLIDRIEACMSWFNKHNQWCTSARGIFPLYHALREWWGWGLSIRLPNCYRGFPSIWKQSIPVTPVISWNGIKWRSSYHRPHLANESTKLMETKHRCSQI